MWSITVEVSSLTVFHSKFTCAGLWATELDGRRWFEAAGGSWEFHIIRSICSLMKTCKCEMQFQLKGLSKGFLHYRALVWYLHHLSPSRFFPGRGWHCWLLSRWLYLKYSHLMNANISMKTNSQQKIVFHKHLMIVNIYMKHVTRKPTNIFCVSQMVPTSLSLFLLTAFLEGAGCWFEDRGWNRKKL